LGTGIAIEMAYPWRDGGGNTIEMEYPQHLGDNARKNGRRVAHNRDLARSTKIQRLLRGSECSPNTQIPFAESETCEVPPCSVCAIEPTECNSVHAPTLAEAFATDRTSPSH
jgi:hypothetical protein